MRQKFQGVFPILATTFHHDGTLDIGSEQRLIEHLLQAGAHGLGLFGNASEGYTLLECERDELQTVIVKAVNGRVPVIVSAAHSGTDAAVRLCRKAEDLGADGLLVLPPFYLKPDANGIFDYYAAIDMAVHIPVMVQDAPLMTGINMTPGLLARMDRDLKNVRYVKVEATPTAPKVGEIVRDISSKFTVFGGLNGQFMLEELGRGARGTMPGSDMTRHYVEIWNHFEAGDNEAAWSKFTRALPLMRFELQPGMGVSAMKHNLVSEGIIESARVRHPTRSLNPESLSELQWLRERLSCA
ncbi:MAG TPA: dihydrodipicolinate synthase family protein [Bryobacteraceae bacterium]